MRFKSYALKMKKIKKNKILPVIEPQKLSLKFNIVMNFMNQPSDVIVTQHATGDFTYAFSGISIYFQNEIIYNQNENETGIFLGDITKYYDKNEFIIGVHPPKELDMMN